MGSHSPPCALQSISPQPAPLVVVGPDLNCIITGSPYPGPHIPSDQSCSLTFALPQHDCSLNDIDCVLGRGPRAHTALVTIDEPISRSFLESRIRPLECASKRHKMCIICRLSKADITWATSHVFITSLENAWHPDSLTVETFVYLSFFTEPRNIRQRLHDAYPCRPIDTSTFFSRNLGTTTRLSPGRSM